MDYGKSRYLKNLLQEDKTPRANTFATTMLIKLVAVNQSLLVYRLLIDGSVIQAKKR